MLDLVIVGCGPVGAMAGNLAGGAGLATVVLDRATDVFDLPRAIHFDAHIMRILQQVGLARDMLPDVRVWQRSTFYGADAEVIRVHDWPTDKPYGWDAHYLFYQPKLEAALRSGLDRLDEVDVRLGVEALAIAQHEDHVTVTTRDTRSGRVRELSARYLIGADGAASFVRNSTGIRLVDGDFDEPWLVVDVRCDREIGRPNESEMFCDPARPATRVPGPGNHHRWEFMLLPGETPEDIQRPESTRALLAPWIGLDEAEIIRASVYRFHSLIAQKWRSGRVFLAGDAAHQTPPFLGQGMCHGMRDVHNLIGKLAAVRAGGPQARLLDSYEAERRPHVERIIGMAVAAGREICVLDPVEAVERDRRLRRAAATGNLPRTTFQGMPPLVGGLLDTTPGAGELFFQPLVHDRSGPPIPFDEALSPQVVVVALEAEAAEIRAVTDKLDIPLVAVQNSADGPHIRDAAVRDWFNDHGVRFAIVRPDRYVLGTAENADDATALIQAARQYFPQIV
jgi:3-(3-hydroxy-phenyl)propionate hydroxylase